VKNVPKGRPKSKVDVACQNPKCTHYLKEKDKTIVKQGKYKTTGHQRYQCKHCNTYFMQTKGTPLYRKHLTEQQITNICKHLVEKNGIRSIERLTDHHRDTIGNLLEDMAEHATELNDYLIKDLGLSQYECDEIWMFIKKKKRRLSGKAKLSLKAATATSTPP
jgi:transposase-like protein